MNSFLVIVQSAKITYGAMVSLTSLFNLQNKSNGVGRYPYNCFYLVSGSSCLLPVLPVSRSPDRPEYSDNLYPDDIEFIRKNTKLATIKITGMNLSPALITYNRGFILNALECWETFRSVR